MGVTAALNYAADNPGDVCCIVGFIPAVDLDALRDGNVGGSRAGIDTAYGVSYPAALPAGSNPADRVEELAGVPIQLWVASDDTTSVNAAFFAEDTGAEIHDVGTLGHDNDSLAAVDVSAVMSFIASHAII